MQCSMVNAFFDVVGSLTDEQKVPRDYGTGHALYHSEMSFLDTVRTHPDMRATDLSVAIGVTCGAVTQIGNKLVEKGLLERYTAPGNRKEKYYRLTDNGTRACEGHLAYHAEANARMCAYLSSLDASQQATITGFLQTLKAAMPICVFPCAHQDGCAGTCLPQTTTA